MIRAIIQFFNGKGVPPGGGPPPSETVLFNEGFGADGVHPTGAPNTLAFANTSQLYNFPTAWTSNSVNDVFYIVTPSYASGLPNSNLLGSSGAQALYMAPYFGSGVKNVKTKSFSTVGYTSVTLTFSIIDSQNFNPISLTKFTVEYSIDNSTWHALTVSANTSNFNGWQNVNPMAMPLADNQATVYVRINFNDDGDGREMFIDDIKVTGT